MHTNQNDIKNISIFAKNMRLNILNMALSAGSNSSHFGGALSIVEILATLFSSIMKRNGKKVSQDRFILS